MRGIFAIVVLVLAAGCAGPREVCVADATRDLRVVDRLIARDRETLDRGYALRREARITPRLSLCSGIGGRVSGGACVQPRVTERLVPQAVDLGAVRSRLRGLEDKRAELARRSARDIADCRRAYPAG